MAAESRYRGLCAGVQVALTGEDAGLLVRPDVARQQMDAETIPPKPTIPGSGPATPPETAPTQLVSGRIYSSGSINVYVTDVFG